MSVVPRLPLKTEAKLPIRFYRRFAVLASTTRVLEIPGLHLALKPKPLKRDRPLPLRHLLLPWESGTHLSNAADFLFSLASLQMHLRALFQVYSRPLTSPDV